MKLLLKSFRVWCAVCIFLGLHIGLYAEDEKQANKPLLQSGEVFNYRVRWEIFEVGTARLEIKGPVEYAGVQAYEIDFRVKTNAFADTFYKIRDATKSYVDPEITRSLGYIQLKNEGSHKRDIVVDIDWKQYTAKRTNFGKPDGEIVQLGESAYDPLSLVFAMRRLALEVEDVLLVPTTNGKRLVDTEIKVVKRDQLKVPAGIFNALLLKPDTKDMRGVFRKSRGAGIDFWCSDDERKVPLMIQSRVGVGSFKVELESIEGPDSNLSSRIESEPKKKKKRKRNNKRK